MRFLLFGGFYFGKMLKIWEKRPFFRADMAGLGNYCTGRYGRIGVYRVTVTFHESIVAYIFHESHQYIINIVSICYFIYNR